MACALPAQLRTDRAAGAGHHHRAPAQPGADQLPVRDHRLAPEQVFDRHFLQFARQRLAFQRVDQAGHHPERQAGAFADAHDPTHGRRIQRRHGDDQHAGRRLACHFRGIFQPPQHRQAVQAGATQPWRVVKEAHRVEGAGALQVAHQRVGRTPGAEDQHPARGGLPPLAHMVLPHPVRQPRQAQQGGEQERIGHQHRSRHRAQPVVHGQPQDDGGQAPERGLEDVPQVRDAGEAPQAPIQAHAPEHQSLGDQHPGHGRGKIQPRPGFLAGEVTQDVKHLPAHIDHHQVVGDDGDTGQQGVGFGSGVHALDGLTFRGTRRRRMPSQIVIATRNQSATPPPVDHGAAWYRNAARITAPMLNMA